MVKSTLLPSSFSPSTLFRIINALNNQNKEVINYSRCYYEDGSVEWEEWRKEGKEHREERDSSERLLPAVIYYREDGRVQREVWFHNGFRNRGCETERDSDGEVKPSYIEYNPDGSVFRKMI